jgi:hypothetical protein
MDSRKAPCAASHEQQRISRQEGQDDNPGLDENHREQRQVDERTVVRRERAQVGVKVQHPIDQRAVHAPRFRDGCSFFCMRVLRAFLSRWCDKDSEQKGAHD